jgi:hypothetical protein
VDEYSEYLSKWDTPAKKAIELEIRLSDKVRLYDAYADFATWVRIEPRLIEVTSKLLDKLRAIDDVLQLKPDEFEQLVGEVLSKIGYPCYGFRAGRMAVSTLSHLRVRKTF